MFAITALLASTIPFWYATAEQYYTGKLVLGPINGIDEGSLVFSLMCFISAYYGATNFWNQEIAVFGYVLPYHEFVHNLMMGSTLFMIIPK